MYRVFVTIVFSLLFTIAFAQTYTQKNASGIKSDLEKLNVLGSVLYFAAHPDDENTKLIAWLANEQQYQTAYLSLTRGDGGQNLIGTELGIELGMIRTQELLAARRIDGGRQYFSSAYDFGFSKTFDETFAFWNKQETLREAVWLIRTLRPDIIITRFPPDPRGGHGHHQASAILAREAFIAAADSSQFPEQLQELDVWQAKRIVWNTFNFGGHKTTADDQLKIETGAYNPLLGASYGEIAALSRSQHKSQGFGAAPSRGQSTEYFEHVAGEEAQYSLMDGVRTDWSRIPNSRDIEKMVASLIKSFDSNAPQKSIAPLIALHKRVQKIGDQHWRTIKLNEIEELVLACAGFHVESYTRQAAVAAGKPLTILQEIIVQNPDVAVHVNRVAEQTINQKLTTNELFRFDYTTSPTTITQPYWLRKPYSIGKFNVDPAEFGAAENPDRPQTALTITIEGLTMSINTPIVHRFVDPVLGEVKNPLQVIPPITASAAQTTLLLREQDQAENIAVTFTRHDERSNATISVNAPAGVKVSPQQATLTFGKSKTVTHLFQVQQVASTRSTTAESPEITFSMADDTLRQYRPIRYNHIPAQAWFPKLSIKAESIDLQVPVRRVAYVMGAGDRVPESLRAIGITTELIVPAEIPNIRAAQYDAIIMGVRAYNVYQNLEDYTPALMDFAAAGGTVLVQYQVNTALPTEHIGPYPFEVTRARVTEEDAAVTFLLPEDPVLQKPNRIGQADFSNWIQERGLYFVEQADQAYRKPLAMHDKNEAPHDGSLIIAREGKGKFVYTSLAFFRQLPAGVPGAYRLFVNLLAKEED